MSFCKSCNNRILSHSRHLTCDLCHKKYHILCLPGVTKHDSMYIQRGFDPWYCTDCTGTSFPFNSISDQSEFINAISENWSAHE